MEEEEERHKKQLETKRKQEMGSANTRTQGRIRTRPKLGGRESCDSPRGLVLVKSKGSER
jgi:hypothetical protein